LPDFFMPFYSVGSIKCSNHRKVPLKSIANCNAFYIVIKNI